MKKRKTWKRRSLDWVEVVADTVEAVISTLVEIIRW